MATADFDSCLSCMLFWITAGWGWVPHILSKKM